MTTDTAVRVTRMVVEGKSKLTCVVYLVFLQIGRLVMQVAVALDKIPYVDFPELKFNQHESTQMPFRYVTDEDGEPVMPNVCLRFPVLLSLIC
jgi:ribosome biogenesis SPOUT family RNA methylase Rps3